MANVAERLRGFAGLWLSSKTNCEIIHGINGVELSTDDLIAAADRIEALETTLRQIADSGDGSINAHLAAQALETEHGNG